jgi:mannose-6-phosphate isomerase-like protein (cupin superfamily)
MLPITKQNILEKIEATPLDPAVGIRLALLWEESDKSYYGSIILPHKKIAAHYHNEGDELYFIIEGKGLMRLGVPSEAGVKWQHEFEVCGGDFFTVPAKAVHQLVNMSDEDMLAVFACDNEHLSGDRFMVAE